tara:strand:+ start:285 stop:476 length:192 start_codon:yes stop_codon:yes gene_type:complete
MVEIEKTKNIVTSFKANGQNWKKLKILAAIDGLPVQEKLNQIIEKYLNQYYNKSLGIEENNAN